MLYHSFSAIFGLAINNFVLYKGGYHLGYSLDGLPVGAIKGEAAKRLRDGSTHEIYVEIE